jgi:hypothetical protein
MKRREFLKSLGDAAARSLAGYFATVALPIATLSQAAEKVQRVGVLFWGLSSDPELKFLAAQLLGPESGEEETCTTS